MRLKKLYVQRYKNLVDFSVDFESGNGLSIIIGNNGSGKSNLLEVISGIFHDLFKEKPDRKIAYDYTLEYELNDVFCRIEQKGGILRCYDPKFRNKESFIANHVPNSIIGLYSGEEDRLWIQYFRSYYNAYIRRIKSYRYQDRMRLVLIDKRYWDIALLTMLLSNNRTLIPFINDELNISSIDSITISFNFHHYSNANELLKSFVDRINPNHDLIKEYKTKDLNRSLFFDVLTDDEGNVLADEEGNVLITDSGVTDLEVFRFFTQSYFPSKEKLINRIMIKINGGLTIRQLSEGEKKLILVKTILEILADEKSLLLLDEPDAHLHESRKQSLISIMREYPNRQIVLATHSPIIAQLVNDNELIMLENADGNVRILSKDKKEKIKLLSGSSWDIISQSMILYSKRPLVVFEGKTDIKYVKKAVQMLQHNEPKYSRINVDYISCGGADNAQFFIKDILSIIPSEKKIYIFFDRDNEGKKGAAAVLGVSKDNEEIVNCYDIKKDNLTIGFIPYREGVTSGDFLIEDYFLWDPTVKQMVEKEINDKHHPLKNLPSLANIIKNKIEASYNSFSEEEFVGFKPIIEKIYSISSVSSEG